MSYGDCFGTSDRPHRFVMFDRGEGPCPICHTLTALSALRTIAMERHAEVGAPGEPYQRGLGITEEDLAFQREPSLASWAKATVARYRQRRDQMQAATRLRELNSAARTGAYARDYIERNGRERKISAAEWFRAALRSLVPKKRPRTLS